MKEIHLKQYTLVNGHYKVTLGNGIYKEFLNRKNCKKFLADCNRYLTLKLIEANTIFVTLFIHYRRNWFYFDHNKHPSFQLYESDRLCKRNMDSIEKVFDIMVERSHYQNGNHFVFAHFQMIFRDMKQIITYMSALMKSKSNAVDVHEMQVLLLSILKAERELYEFDGTFTKEQLDADEIFTRNGMKVI
jgi:hypothetical protein